MCFAQTCLRLNWEKMRFDCNFWLGVSYWHKVNVSELHSARSFQGYPSWPYLARSNTPRNMPNMAKYSFLAHIWAPLYIHFSLTRGDNPKQVFFGLPNKQLCSKFSELFSSEKQTLTKFQILLFSCWPMIKYETEQTIKSDRSEGERRWNWTNLKISKQNRANNIFECSFVICQRYV